MWPGAGLLPAPAGLASPHRVAARVSADAYGLHSRTLLGGRGVPWHDIADLRVHVKSPHNSRGTEARRVSLLLRDGRRRLPALPRSRPPGDPESDAKPAALRTLHRRHGAPRSSHVPWSRTAPPDTASSASALRDDPRGRLTVTG
ncbi:PH domain-containing protein [Streptomyces sp. NPDC051636]|uniref:PH domain-containing protein n=1 Tax=Streptomyces sp. NPDC051636 TaxID=3365663 RepID=UPI003799EFA1